MRIEYLEYVSPDYFRGFSGIVFAVPWYPEQTWKNIKEELIQEIESVDSGQWDIAEFNESYYSLVKDVFCDETLDETFPVMSEYFDDKDYALVGSLYHYFGLVES
jgi:hypothetical protein